MYIWFMLGYGAATGDVHVYICVCDETWKYYDEIFREHSFRTSASRYVRSNFSFLLLCLRRVYGCGNKWIVYTLAASTIKYLLKLKMLQYFDLPNWGFAVS